MAGARSATAPAQPRTGGQSWERSATNASPPAKAAAPKKKAQPIGVCAFFATHGKCGKGEACRCGFLPLCSALANALTAPPPPPAPAPRALLLPLLLLLLRLLLLLLLLLGPRCHAPCSFGVCRCLWCPCCCSPLLRQVLPRPGRRAGPSSTRILGYFSVALSYSNETVCVLNHQRRLTLPRPTATPTAAQLIVFLHFIFCVDAGLP